MLPQLAEDTVLEALFKAPAEAPLELCVCGNRHRSSRTVESHAIKKRTQVEQDRRALIVY